MVKRIVIATIALLVIAALAWGLLGRPNDKEMWLKIEQIIESAALDCDIQIVDFGAGEGDGGNVYYTVVMHVADSPQVTNSISIRAKQGEDGNWEFTKKSEETLVTEATALCQRQSENSKN